MWHEPGPITADSGVLIIGEPTRWPNPTPDVILVPADRPPSNTPATRCCWTGYVPRADRNLDDVECARVRSSSRPPAARRASVPAVALGGPDHAESFGRQARWRRTGGARRPWSSPARGCRRASTWRFWLAGQIGGEERAKVIQLSMEYDPQPPFDSGHMSKASAKTKAVATALMARDIAKPAQLKAGRNCCGTARSTAARQGSPSRRSPARVDTASGFSIETKILTWHLDQFPVAEHPRPAAGAGLG